MIIGRTRPRRSGEDRITRTDERDLPSNTAAPAAPTAASVSRVRSIRDTVSATVPGDHHVFSA